jgi:hypothetical protein
MLKSQLDDQAVQPIEVLAACFGHSLPTWRCRLRYRIGHRGFGPAMERLFGPQQQQSQHTAAVLGEQQGRQRLMHGRHQLSLYLPLFCQGDRG